VITIKTNFKKILALCLITSIIFQQFTLTALAADAPSPWAVEQVNAAIAKHIVPENLQSNYTQPITRAEFCALIVVAYERFIGDIAGRRLFNDTNDINVQKAAYLRIVSGVGDNRFDPNGTLTREQAAVMLERFADFMGGPLLFEDAPVFVDSHEISEWAVRSVSAIVMNGIMSGMGNGEFAPGQSLTREQSIVAIMQLLDVRSSSLRVPAEWVGSVILVANGVLYEPRRHGISLASYSNGELLMGTGITLENWLELYLEWMPMIQYTNNLQIIVEGGNGQVGINPYIERRFDDPELYWLEALRDELLGDIIIVGIGAERFVDGVADVASMIPNEVGIYLIHINVAWSSDGEENVFVRYLFKVVR